MSECIQKWEGSGKGQGWISLALHQPIKPTMPGLLWETADSQGAPAERMEPAERELSRGNAHGANPEITGHCKGTLAVSREKSTHANEHLQP